MACSEGFWRKDGPYSWIILLIMVVNSSMVGILYTIFGVMTEKYPHLMGIEQSSANLVGSVGLGIFLFTGKNLLHYLHTHNITLQMYRNSNFILPDKPLNMFFCVLFY